MVMEKSKNIDDETANNKVDGNTRKVSFILKKKQTPTQREKSQTP